jgi:6-phosphogluconolactonase
MAATGMNADAAPQNPTFDTPDELAQHVADWMVERALERRERFAVCLSGGSTPKRLYELLATAPRAARFPWDRTHWFWGDERLVPHDDARSNFHMAREALLRYAPVPADNIHPIPTGPLSAAACAAQYETALRRFYGADTLHNDRPLFDLTLLGLGEDGHIASLFPGSPAVTERQRWAVPVIGEKSPDRITLTYPALESSRVIAFLVVGDDKRDVLARVRNGDPALPAARLRPAGAVYWFTDRAASPLPHASPLAGEARAAALARE